MSIPESGIEYEIYATPDEMKEIEMLFVEKRKSAKNALKYIGKPFDEWGVDDERNRYDKSLIKIYEKVYEHGVPITKEKINEIGLLK